MLQETVVAPPARVCPGHERAIPIQSTVQSLDIKEEGKTTISISALSPHIQ